jgi:hypothetical protein
MCFVLYAGTTKPLPLKKWNKDAPSLSVESLPDRATAIKSYFSNPVIQYVGSTSGCGCDFPHASFQNGGWPEIEYEAMRLGEKSPDEVASDQVNRKALVELLRNTNEQVVELYGLWDGDFSEAPQARETIAVVQILDAAFRFKERGFYKVLL